MSERLSNNPERDTSERFARYVIDHMPDKGRRHKDSYGPVFWDLELSDQGVPIEQVYFQIDDNDRETPILIVGLQTKNLPSNNAAYEIIWNADCGFDLYYGTQTGPADEEEVNRLLDLLETWENQGSMVPSAQMN